MSSAPQDFDEDIAPGILPALPQILWQRRWLLIVPTIVAAVGGTAAALLLPPLYESSATVLIESQQLPADLVDSPVTDVIEQRISRARERVLSRQDLIRLIRSDNLYPREQRSQPLSTIVDKMRNSTSVTAVGSDIAGRQDGRGTIALKISFDYPEPVKAQAVAQKLVNNFLSVDASAQADQAVGAATFLRQQVADVQGQIAAIEDQVTKIKVQNGAVLAMPASTGDPVRDAATIDSQIAMLRVTMAGAGSGAGASPTAAAQANLDALRARLSESHPDVVAARAQLAAAKQAAGAASGPDPQAAAIRSQIAQLQAAKGMLFSQSAVSRSAQARGPALAAQVDQLEKRADVLRDQQRTLGAKLQGAEVSARMETEQKGERLTLADPPVVPDKPSKPNRPIVALGATAAGIGVGLALILLIELLLRPIRGTDALRAAAGQPPLVIIPDYERKPQPVVRWLERWNRRRRRPMRA